LSDDADLKDDFCRQMFKALDENLRTDLKRRLTSSEILEILRIIAEWQVETYKRHLVDLAQIVNWPDNYTDKTEEEIEGVMEELKRI
jgi:hypothetical protein